MGFVIIRRRRLTKNTALAVRYGTYGRGRTRYNSVSITEPLMAAVGFSLGDHLLVEYDRERRRLRLTKTDDACAYTIRRASRTSDSGRLQFAVLPDRPLPDVHGGLLLIELDHKKGVIEGTIPEGHDAAEVCEK